MPQCFFIIFLLLCVPSWATSGSDLSLYAGSALEDEDFLSKKSRSILEIFYITKKFERSFKVMEKALRVERNKKLYAKFVGDFFSQSCFLLKTDVVKKVVDQIRQTHSFAPHFTLWNHIKRFKYGLKPEEMLILLDFAKVHLVACQLILLKEHSFNWIKTAEAALSLLELEKRCPIFKEINLLTSYFLQNNISSNHAAVLNCFLSQEGFLEKEPFLYNALFEDIYFENKIDHVILRFYHLRRVGPVVSYIKKISKYITCADNQKFLDLGFEQEPILVMIGALQGDCSLKSFYLIWNDLKKYKYIREEKIFKEFAYFLLYFMSTLCIQERLKVLDHTISLERLSAMELEDILDLLDLLEEQLPAFLEKYELDGHSDLTWHAWFKKYWLVVPVSACILAVKIYVLSQRLHDDVIKGGSLKTFIAPL